MAAPLVTFSVRIAPELAAALDAEGARLAALAGLEALSRNDVVGVLLRRALAAGPGSPLPADPPAAAPTPRRAPPAPVEPPSGATAEAVRRRYRAALTAGSLVGNRTAMDIGCSEAALRKWSKGEAASIPPRALTALARLLDERGL